MTYATVMVSLALDQPNEARLDTASARCVVLSH
jgi:hypothetical protein